MKKIAGIIALCSVLLFAGAACNDQNSSQADIKEPKVSGDILPSDYEARPPDKLTVFQNVDQHPTIVRLCIDKVAFMTVSSAHSSIASPAVQRVPEWDSYCAS